MAQDTIGTARIDVVVDTSQLEIAVDRAKNRTASMSNAAQQEYAKLDKAEKRRVDRLIDQANTIDLNRQQQLAYNAALRTSGPILDEINKRLARTEAAHRSAGNAATLSAKQTAAALRGVPAQVTDIFTSLAGGQNPLTVLLQQGGQLKDMFGGVGPAARALGGSLLGLVNPATLSAAAVAGLAAAVYSAQKRTEEFAISAAKGNGFAGTTEELVRMANAINEIAGVSSGNADEAVQRLAASGRLAGENFRLAAEASAHWATITGEGADEVASKFEHIARDPLQAMIDGTVRLTESQYRQITALMEQGDEQGVVNELIRIYYDQINTNSANAEAHLSSMGAFWREMKDDIGSAWKELSGFADEFAGFLIQAGKAGQVGKATDPFNAVVRLVRGMYSAEPASRSSPASASGGPATIRPDEIKARMDAEKEFERLAVSNLSKRQKLEREIRDIRELGVKAGRTEADIQKQITAARARYAESEAKRAGGGSKTNPADAILSRLSQQIALNKEQLASEEKLTTTERLLVDIREDLERVGRKLTAEDRARIEARIAEAAATGAAVDAHLKEVKAKEALSRLNAQLTAQEANQARGNTLDLLGFGQGADALVQMRRGLELQQWYADEVAKLRDRGLAETDDEYKAQEAALRESLNRRLQAEDDYQRARAAAMADWTNGANKALQDYVAAGQDVAGQMEDVWGEVFGVAEEIGGDALTGNLQDWDTYFAALEKKIAAFLVRQQLTKLLQTFMGGMDSEGNNWGSIFDLFGSGDSSMGSEYFAKGGAFAGGVQKFANGAAFTNKIINKPTLFKFANGTGVMGEAGEEAIMPLRRTAGGRLGVEVSRAPGTGSSRAMPALNQTFVVQGTPDRRTLEQMARDAGRQTSRALARTGR